MRQLLAIFTLGFCVCPLQAQTNSKIAFDGPEVFAHILHSFKLKPIRDPFKEKIDPANTLIVVFGSWPSFIDDPRIGGLKRFQDAGGNLLLAIDEPTTKTYSWNFRVLNVATTKASSGYQGRSECPLLSLSAHPITRILSSKPVSNCPHALKITKVTDLVAISKVGESDQIHILGSPGVKEPSGRLLAFGGYGVFMNGMLAQPASDAGNFDLAMNCVRWLGEKPDGVRENVLFVIDSMVVTELAPSLKLPPLLPPIPLTTIVNHLLRGLEDDRVVEKVLNQNPDLVEKLSQGFLLNLSLILLFACCFFIARTRFHPETKAKLLVGPHAQLEVAAIPLDARHQAQLDNNNLTESAQALARDWLHQRLGIETSFEKPQLEIVGSAWECWRLKRRVLTIWHLASDPHPSRVTKRGFLRLVEQLDLLSKEIEAGRLRSQS